MRAVAHADVHACGRVAELAAEMSVRTRVSRAGLPTYGSVWSWGRLLVGAPLTSNACADPSRDCDTFTSWSLH